MKPLRRERLGSFIQREISNIIHKEVKDPRIKFVTITRAEVSTDLENVRVYVSVWGTEEEKQTTMRAMVKASKFFRHHLGKALKTRRIPYIIFVRDDSLEEGDRVLNKIYEIFPDSDIVDRDNIDSNKQQNEEDNEE